MSQWVTLPQNQTSSEPDIDEQEMNEVPQSSIHNVPTSASKTVPSKKRKELPSREPDPRSEKLPRIDFSTLTKRIEKPVPSSSKSSSKPEPVAQTGPSSPVQSISKISQTPAKPNNHIHQANKPSSSASAAKQKSTTSRIDSSSESLPDMEQLREYASPPKVSAGRSRLKQPCRKTSSFTPVIRTSKPQSQTGASRTSIQLNESVPQPLVAKGKDKARAVISDSESLASMQQYESTSSADKIGQSRPPNRTQTARKSMLLQPGIKTAKPASKVARRHTLATEVIILSSSDNESDAAPPPPPPVHRPIEKSKKSSWHIEEDIIIIDDSDNEEPPASKELPSVTSPTNIALPPEKVTPVTHAEDVHAAEEGLQNIHLAEPLAKLTSPAIRKVASPTKQVPPGTLNSPMERLSLQPASQTPGPSVPTRLPLFSFQKGNQTESRPTSKMAPPSSSEDDNSARALVRPRTSPIKKNQLAPAEDGDLPMIPVNPPKTASQVTSPPGFVRQVQLGRQRGRKSIGNRTPRRANPFPQRRDTSSEDSDIEFVGYGDGTSKATNQAAPPLTPPPVLAAESTITSDTHAEPQPTSSEGSTPAVSSEGPNTPVHHPLEEPTTPGPLARRAPNLSTAQTISNFASSSRPLSQAVYTSLREIEEKMGLSWINPFDSEEMPAVKLPSDLQDQINRLPSTPFNRVFFKQIIKRGTEDDEPHAPEIEISNDVDNEPCPAFEFVWTNRMLYGEGVPRMNRDLKGCGCPGGKCDPRSKTCACVQRQEFYYKAAGWRTSEEDTAEGDDDDIFNGFVYDEHTKLLRAHAIPIWECNAACGCSDACPNRVVQNGRKVRLTLKKTRHKGWGVFAGENIPQGTFIGIYSGELVTTKEADLRGQVYETVGKTYLFDVDSQQISNGVFHDSPVISSIVSGSPAPKSVQNKKRNNVKYSVDAFHAGNHTRFFNHSCEPNIDLNHCYTYDADVEKPLLCAFTNQLVMKNQELCFSYHGIDQETAKKMRKKSSKKRNRNTTTAGKCMCMSKNCLGFVFKQGYLADGDDEDDDEDDNSDSSD